ncbi:prepilin peptidase [Gallibacterium melopsittaci]|uniref:Prepilin peptidase n=1 Tax=Gallibacterium melopsittaci TaxID=516063 RepID=A0ABV6HZA6_9PAST
MALPTPPKKDRYIHLVIYTLFIISCLLTTSLWWHTYLYYCLLSFCYVIAYLDYRYRLISIVHCYIIIMLALLFVLLQLNHLTIEQAIISFCFAFIGSISCYFVCFFWYGKEKLGMGDILLFSALALFISPTQLPYLLLLASSITITYYIITHNKNHALPFAPGLVIAMFILFSINNS